MTLTSLPLRRSSSPTLAHRRSRTQAAQTILLATLCAVLLFLTSALTASAQVAYGGLNDPSNPNRPPANSVGLDNAFYIDFLSGNVFGPKTSGQWPITPIAQFGLGGPTPSAVILTSTEVSITGGTAGAQILPANAIRRYLSITNDGTGNCRIGYGLAPTSTTGEPLNGAGVANQQGGNKTFESSIITLQAIFAFCPTGASTTFAIVEGQ